MQFSQTTVLGFFDSSQKSYEIPVYQRAYSWEKEEWDMFLQDLLEQLEGDNNYFYGNILLETITKNKKYEIIDGQQRTITLTIFIRAILNTLSNKKDDALNEFDFEEKSKIYLKNNGNIKIRPVEYDRACYDSLIIDNKDTYGISTPSQQRMLEAKSFFTAELKKLPTDKVLRILDKIENTELTTIALDGKKDSSLMFELSNNRGKELTNMEKLKSYFMYQTYVFSKEEETETNIEYISNIFKDIYQTINGIKLNEDSILIYHNNAYINGFNYRTLDDVKQKFKRVDDKINWIKRYIFELQVTFASMKNFEKTSGTFATHLKNIGIPAFVYPFIVKGYKYFDNDIEKLDKLFHILEKLTFRAKLIGSRANIQERLNSILLDFTGNIEKLQTEIKNKLNDAWYWSDNRVKEYLNEWMYENAVLKYLLWRYEAHIQNKGYGVKGFEIKNEQIEHISPQTPTDGNSIESGYEVDDDGGYSEDFEDDYLNCIGNLMLISGSHNSSIGNKPFEKKLLSYNENPLLNQQAEIKNFVKKEGDNNVWKEESIDERHKVIVEFAIATWSFE